MKNGSTYNLPWLGKPRIETLFILAPPFVCLLLIASFPSLFADAKEVPLYSWVLLVLLVDVAHVYSTLFRTYLDKNAWKTYGTPMRLIPLLSLLVGILLYSITPMLFWSVLAYLAVFHFIRQQFGIMRLYSRTEQLQKWMRHTDTFAIYYGTLYPIIFWHLSSSRNFNWFVEGDFVTFESQETLIVFTCLYYIMLAIYITKEFILTWQTRHINLPRVAVITGTLASWYFGIVYFNGDMAFTMLNVISHGIPYMALIWIFVKQNSGNGTFWNSVRIRSFWNRYGLIGFIFIIATFAFVEEGLWDAWVWKERESIFAPFYRIDFNGVGHLLNIFVPLLSVPQITHYIIDGFIWRKKKDTSTTPIQGMSANS